MDEKFLKQVYQRLTKGVTVEDVPFLIEAYTRIGHDMAAAKAVADDAAAVRKHEESKEFVKAKQQEGRTSDSVADRLAVIATFDLRRAEVAAEQRYSKVRHLREAVYQALSSLRAGTITIGGLNDE